MCVAHLGKVADDVVKLAGGLGQDVEHEWLNVKVDSLMVDEKLAEQGQILTIKLRRASAWVWKGRW